MGDKYFGLDEDELYLEAVCCSDKATMSRAYNLYEGALIWYDRALDYCEKALEIMNGDKNKLSKIDIIYDFRNRILSYIEKLEVEMK